MAYRLVAYLAIQMNEIREHKYYLSEKMGQDVGMDMTLADWQKNHAQRFQEAFFANIERIDDLCESKCPGKGCKGVKGCVLSMKDIHDILKD